MLSHSLNDQNEKRLLNYVKNILRKHNLLFPTNETEFNDLVNLVNKDPDNLPESLDDISKIFSPSRARYLKNAADDSMKNFSLAARSGARISEKDLELILNKIKCDDETIDGSTE